jgi:hypothetical protein
MSSTPPLNGNLGTRLAIPIRSDDLRVAVLHLVQYMVPVLDVMAIVLLLLHDVMNGARRVVLVVVLFTLVVTLVDVAAGIAGTPVIVEVVVEVAILGTVSPTSGLVGVVLVDLLRDRWRSVRRDR